MSDIRAKILALRNMITERGATEAEAMAALAKADKLMAEHGLTEADLEVAEAKRDMSVGEFKYGIKTQHPCAKWCSKTIGEFCGVITWYDPNGQKSSGFGFNADVEMYEFLLKLVHDSMNREWKNYLATNPPKKGVSRHTEYWSFMLGMAQRINEKLQELMQAREVKVDSTGTDLVVKKYAIIQAGMKEMLPDLHFRKANSRGILADSSAMNKGRKAGDRVNLNRPLKNGPNVRKAITC
jgi:putative ubiquitin-RnfH superfamily antitoxin RatB of RatAB toxin-antitoxin module